MAFAVAAYESYAYFWVEQQTMWQCYPSCTDRRSINFFATCAVLGSNSSTIGVHLPFAEASMSHKHRKRRSRVTGDQEEGQEDQDQAEDGDTDDSPFSPADAGTDFLQQPPSLATEV